MPRYALWPVTSFVLADGREVYGTEWLRVAGEWLVSTRGRNRKVFHLPGGALPSTVKAVEAPTPLALDWWKATAVVRELPYGDGDVRVTAPDGRAFYTDARLGAWLAVLRLAGQRRGESKFRAVERLRRDGWAVDDCNVGQVRKQVERAVALVRYTWLR